MVLKENLTAKFFKKHIHKITEHYYEIQLFEEGPESSINEMMTLIKDIPNLNVNWWSFSRLLPIHLIETNMHLPWDWCAVSRNPNLTPAFIEKYVNTHNWQWYVLSENPAVTMDFVETHQGERYRWDWDALSLNPNITFEFIQKHSDKLNFQRVLKNEFIFENRKNRQKEDYALLEKERTLPKLVNLHIISKYM